MGVTVLKIAENWRKDIKPETSFYFSIRSKGCPIGFVALHIIKQNLATNTTRWVHVLFITGMITDWLGKQWNFQEKQTNGKLVEIILNFKQNCRLSYRISFAERFSNLLKSSYGKWSIVVWVTVINSLIDKLIWKYSE